MSRLTNSAEAYCQPLSTPGGVTNCANAVSPEPNTLGSRMNRIRARITPNEARSAATRTTKRVAARTTWRCRLAYARRCTSSRSRTGEPAAGVVQRRPCVTGSWVESTAGSIGDGDGRTDDSNRTAPLVENLCRTGDAQFTSSATACLDVHSGCGVLTNTPAGHAGVNFRLVRGGTTTS